MLQQKSFRSYTHRVLNKVHPETNITKRAIDTTDGILRTVATRVCHTAHLLTQGTEKKTISAREIQSAVRSVFPSELGEHAMNEGTAAITKFQENIMAKSSSDTPAKPMMREIRAGLVFSVSLAEKYLRGSTHQDIANIMSHYTIQKMAATLDCPGRKAFNTGTIR